MKKKNAFASAAWIAVCSAFVLLGASTAEAENPTVPLFQCAVYFGAQNKPMVKVTHTGGGAVLPNKDVVAVINTPSGKVDATMCGSVFANGGSGTSSWSGVQKQGYLYTCSAYQGTTTFACNPVR